MRHNGDCCQGLNVQTRPAMITILLDSDVEAVLGDTTYSLTHLMHVKHGEDGMQHSGISLDHVELEERACGTIANDERDSTKDQLVPMPR